MFVPAEFSKYGGGEEIWRWCRSACRRLGHFAIEGTMSFVRSTLVQPDPGVVVRNPAVLPATDLDRFDLGYLQHADLTGQDIKHLCE